MGRVGSALDNAVIESWHSTVEFELRRLEHFATKAQARAGSRPGSRSTTTTGATPRSGMRSPIAYELALHAGEPAAGAGGMNDAGSRAPSVAPSSPASRPSPPGGLRPALTPAPGAVPEETSGTPAAQEIHKFRSLRFQGIAGRLRYLQVPKEVVAGQAWVAGTRSGSLSTGSQRDGGFSFG